MSLKALQGTIDAESYLTVSEADDILSAEFAWGELELYVKENSLKLATQLIDSLYLYGNRLITVQSLELPRDYFEYTSFTPTSIFQGTSDTISDTSGVGDTSIVETLSTIVRQGSVEVTVSLLVEGVSTTITLVDSGPSTNPFYHPFYVSSYSLDYDTGSLLISFNYSLEDSSDISIEYRYHPNIQYDSLESPSLEETTFLDSDLYTEGSVIVINSGKHKGIGMKVQHLDIVNGIVITDPFNIELDTSYTYTLVPPLPTNIRNAVALQASYFATNNRTKDLVKRQAGIIQYKIGDVFASYSSDPVAIRNLLYPEAYYYLREYIGKKAYAIGRA